MTAAQLVSALATGLVLSGCSAPSPEARCFAAATEDYRAAWRVARQAEANLDRGYALQRQQIATVRAASCTRRGGPPRDCLVDRREVLQIPVTIDRAREQARLDAANDRMDALRPAAMARAAGCGYGDWSAAYLAARPGIE